MYDLIGREKSTKLPELGSLDEIAEAFSTYFDNKIQLIRTKLDQAASQRTTSNRRTDPPSHHTHQNPFYSVFDEASETEIRKIIMKSPTTSCSLDPLPTQLLKDHLDLLVPAITKLINCSLSSGTVPSKFKQALNTPLIKKPSLDPNILKNYRPVTKLSFLSKVLERVVLTRLSDFLISINQHLPHQSAYRPSHSTETALLRVSNDILTALDERKGTMLVLLDLSAAFDTIDPKLLLARLEGIGVDGAALKWFASYKQERHQTVNIGSSKSGSVPLRVGVPQGSVLGPFLFTLYTRPIGAIRRRHGIDYQLYADDPQVYLNFNVTNTNDQKMALKTKEACVEEIRI